LKIGEDIPSLKKDMSQSMIMAYAEVSGDFNPLHVDPDFAGKTKFGGTIAHGHIAVSWLCEMLLIWRKGDFLKGGKLEGVRFVAPIRPGDTLEVKGRVTETTSDRIMCDVWVENQDGKRVVEGKASIPLSEKT
jgi:3-hydroxybutyryl-CoA dehydratase